MEFADTRGAGILWPVTSTPTKFGIGDLGPESRKVAEEIREAGIVLKQELPFNPTGFGDSPFSSVSAFAGNPYFISPEILIEEQLLSHENTERILFEETGKIDYGFQFENRHSVLEIAYETFKLEKRQGELQEYLKREDSWLREYAIYNVIKKIEGGRSSEEWDDAYRNLIDNRQAQDNFIEKHLDDFNYYVFEQLCFETQYLAYKEFHNNLGIELVGDIPIYVARDSADFYFHPELFKVDQHGRPTGLAGVSPDDFSKTGQFWGNPLYDWDRNYDGLVNWWESRFNRVLKFCDKLKVDHPRGFITYFEIDPVYPTLPEGTKTSDHGKWIYGPGKAFFDEMQKRIKSLPIILEDLGDIDEETRNTLNNLGFPGMSITQFGIGGAEEFFPKNVREEQILYAPGTHDNPTSVEFFDGLEDHKRNEVIHRIRSWGFDFDENQPSGLQVIDIGLSTKAKTAIVHASDVFSLGKEGTLNRPGKGEGNWQTVFPRNYGSALKGLANMLKKYGRKPD